MAMTSNTSTTTASLSIMVQVRRRSANHQLQIARNGNNDDDEVQDNKEDGDKGCPVYVGCVARILDLLSITYTPPCTSTVSLQKSASTPVLLFGGKPGSKCSAVQQHC
jgi:hypothetical protein